MRSPVDNPQFQVLANSSVLMQPNTIRPGQGQRFLSTDELRAEDVITTPVHMRNAEYGYRPVSNIRHNAQQRTNNASRREVMNVLLHGVRRSGSTARSAQFYGTRGLGAVDCSTFNFNALSQEQRDAMVGLMLSVLGRQDAFTHLSAAGAECWFQYLNTVAQAKPEVSPIAAETIAALVAAGVVSPDLTATPSTLGLVSTILVASNLTTKRAVELAKCGAAITAVGGWAQYATLWAESDCMAKSWYENPWYLGGGAAVIIGAVWFATRKKKAG